MKNNFLLLSINFLIIGSMLVPNFSFANTTSNSTKDEIIVMLLEKIKRLELEISQLKKDAKSVKVEITNQNTSYTKVVKPLYDSLKKQESLREKEAIKLSESTCSKPNRVNSKGKTKFYCKDKNFVLDKNINVSEILSPNTKQKLIIERINKIDSEISDIKEDIEGAKILHGLK